MVHKSGAVPIRFLFFLPYLRALDACPCERFLRHAARCCVVVATPVVATAVSRPPHHRSIRPRFAVQSTSTACRHDPACHHVTSREFCQNACRMTAFTPTTPTPRLHLRLLSAIARPTTSSSTTPGSGTTRHTSTSRYAGTCSALMHLYTLGTHTLARVSLCRCGWTRPASRS